MSSPRCSQGRGKGRIDTGATCREDFLQVCLLRTLDNGTGSPLWSSTSQPVHLEASSPSCEQWDDQQLGESGLSELARLEGQHQTHLCSEDRVEDLQVVAPQDLVELDLQILPKQPGGHLQDVAGLILDLVVSEESRMKRIHTLQRCGPQHFRPS